MISVALSEAMERSCLTIVALAALITLIGGAGVRSAGAQCTPVVQHLVNDLELDEARADTKAAIARNAKDDAALHCMGTIALAANDPAGAASWFDKAVNANDQVALHHLWLANALGEQAPTTNRFKLPFLAKRIKSEFDKAATLDPGSVDAKHGLIQFYSRAPSIMGGSMEKVVAKMKFWLQDFF